ncbi:MAG: porin family protein, partial [Gallionella sp.]
GDSEFDYLLGIAALDIGKPNEAIFALERVLAVSPNHLQARAEIARAYLAAGEIATSKQEFETVQNQNPPEEVKATIQKFLAIIESSKSSKKTAFSGYVEAMVGNDSNVNNATSDEEVGIPAFGGAVIALDSSGVAKRDNFGSLAAGLNVRHALTPAWTMLASANVKQRNHSEQEAFNTGNAGVNLGINLHNENDSYLAILQLQTITLDYTQFRKTAGMTLQWQRSLNSGSRITSYLQYSSLVYPDQETLDANRYVLGGAYATSLGSKGSVPVYAGVYVGAEQELDSSLPHLGYTLYGVRAGGEMKINEQLTAISSVSLESRNHDSEDSLFLTKRNDTQADIKIGINYFPAKKWTVGTQLAYTNSDSNIIINKYDRTQISISVRRDFN